MALALNIKPELEDQVKLFVDENDLSVSSFVEEAIAEKLEREEDELHRVIREYETQKANGTLKLYSWEEVQKRNGLL
jgi:predicted transcriptional regulator